MQALDTPENHRRQQKLENALHEAVGGIVRISAYDSNPKTMGTIYEGKLLSMSTGVVILQGIRKYFSICELFVEQVASMVITEATPTEPSKVTFLHMPASLVTDMASDCTCDVDPSQCCDME